VAESLAGAARAYFMAFRPILPREQSHEMRNIVVLRYAQYFGVEFQDAYRAPTPPPCEQREDRIPM